MAIPELLVLRIQLLYWQESMTKRNTSSDNVSPLISRNDISFEMGHMDRSFNDN